jgi:hypothetical protein
MSRVQISQDERDVHDLLLDPKRRHHFTAYGTMPDGESEADNPARYKRLTKLLEERERDFTRQARTWLASTNGGVSGGGENEELRPFALDLNEFVAACSDAPPALIGNDEDNLLPTNGLLLLVAKGGKGKTTIVTDQMFHLASGVEWLGFEVVRPLRVLFIENEGPREPFRRKIEMKRESWTHPISGGIHIYDQDWGQAKLNQAAFVERLNEFVSEQQIDVVIGDPLDTFGMEGVGSPEDTRNMVERLQQAGLFSTVAWELLHHSRKESVGDAVDEASGAWGGKPDTLLVLEKQRGNRARLSFRRFDGADAESEEPTSSASSLRLRLSS